MHRQEIRPAPSARSTPTSPEWAREGGRWGERVATPDTFQVPLHHPVNLSQAVNPTLRAHKYLQGRKPASETAQQVSNPQPPSFWREITSKYPHSSPCHTGKLLHAKLSQATPDPDLERQNPDAHWLPTRCSQGEGQN
ncbi:hypothetical protein SKAU_G00269490 [Synaphobranchus kaupii]|uniref:Uncharacterized protein n=1 Tax=Synaphobranchus kaupii TaxID=118154 RepID=A0A9Q1IPI8_SYNKA|nr:hypothetical protein SKAU_G00269490 [Synaphobranchus kaupii]